MIMNDRGSPFVSKRFYKLLKTKNIVHSMSRPHHPSDNCYIETFWKSMKTETIVTKNSTVESYIKMIRYYEYYYNHKRPHSSLGYKTLIEAA